MSKLGGRCICKFCDLENTGTCIIEAAKTGHCGTKVGATSTSTNSSRVAICAYHKPGWSCPFHVGGTCNSNGCNEAPRIQRQQ